ncbi:MAG: transposase [Bacteroidia bacterium]
MESNRQSYRLKGYDYSRKGFYFITICTHKRACFLGYIKQKQMILSEIGQIASQYFQNIPNHYPHVEVLAQVVMPNHLHGLLYFTEGANFDERVSDFQQVVSKSLSVIINQYKGAVTKYANQNQISFQWQKKFHDAIIWDINDCSSVIHYIENNIENWAEDDFYEEG